MALLATALICTAMSAGCGGPPAVPAAHAAPRPASKFAIAFERSGGLKARVETLVVRPGLHAYATGPKGTRQASAHFRMDAQTAEELRRELAKAHFAHLESTTSATCNDCYVYSITYHGHTVLFSDSKVPRSREEVVDALEGEVIAHLYRHVGYRQA
jgi:1,6-anhydro-N-acetylmuramate kinase